MNSSFGFDGPGLTPGLGPGNAHNHAETMQRLERLNHLETVTAEQRIRIEKYKTMYETLKAESEQLEDGKGRLQQEISMLKDELKEQQKQAQTLIEREIKEKDRKIEECEELRVQILTPQKMEVMKLKMLEEIESPYKMKLESMEIELDRYRSEFNKMRYDYSFLKSEYEHELAQKKTIFEEMEGKRVLEVDSLNKQIAALNEQLNNQEPGDLHKQRVLHRENVQLNLKVKSLTSELDELRDHKEAAGNQSDHASRLQARQLSEYSAQCRSLEAERDTNKLQIDRLQKELEKSMKELDKMSSDLHKLERENMTIKSEKDSLEHAHRVELNNTKVNLTKDRGELERERDNLRAELNMHKNRVNILDTNIQELKRALESKEQELGKRVQAVKEEEWDRLNKLENSKVQLETKLSQLEKDKRDLQSSSKHQIEKMEEKMKADKESKDRFERDLVSTKAVLIEEKQKNKELERDLEKLGDLKVKLQKLQSDYDSLFVSEQEAKADHEKSSHTNDMLRKELDICQNDLVQQRESFNKSIQNKSSKHDEDKKKLQHQLLETKKQLKEMKRQNDKFTHKAKKLNKKHKLEISTLADQVNLLKTKEEHFEMEKQSMMKNMNMERDMIRRRLDKVRQRQSQFSHVLNQSAVLGFPEFSPIVGKTSSFLGEIPPRSEVVPSPELPIPTNILES